MQAPWRQRVPYEEWRQLVRGAGGRAEAALAVLHAPALALDGALHLPSSVAKDGIARQDLAPLLRDGAAGNPSCYEDAGLHIRWADALLGGATNDT